MIVLLQIYTFFLFLNFISVQSSSFFLNNFITRNQKPIFCYIGSWNLYDQSTKSNQLFRVRHIDPFVCTHLIYAFANLNSNYQVDPLMRLEDVNRQAVFVEFNQLKQKNPYLKTLVSIGGINSDPELFSKLAANSFYRRVFINSVIDLINNFNFDGLDLDWEFPGVKFGGLANDKHNLVLLVRELQIQFNKRKWLLTAAISANQNIIDEGYDIAEMNQYVDYFNLMSYDFHGNWENVTGLNSPLFAQTKETERSLNSNVNFTINYLIEKGADPDKLLLGIGGYGHLYRLPNAELAGTAFQAEHQGTLSFGKICDMMMTSKWKISRDQTALAPYAQLNRQWIGFEDPTSVRIKSAYAREMKLGGIMFWSLELDDYRGICGLGSYPLLKAIRSQLNSDTFFTVQL